MSQDSSLGSPFLVVSNSMPTISDTLATRRSITLLTKQGYSNIESLSCRSFQATHPDWGLVVLKLAQQTEHKICLKREAEFLHSYSSAYWATYLDYFSFDATDCLVVSYISGQTLAEHALSPSVNPNWINAVECALIAMHKTNHIHGDIKPSNIILEETGGVKLIDFGSIRKQGEDYLADRFDSYTPSFTARSSDGRYAQRLDDWGSLAISIQRFLQASDSIEANHSESPFSVKLPSRYQFLLLRIQKQ